MLTVNSVIKILFHIFLYKNKINIIQIYRILYLSNKKVKKIQFFFLFLVFIHSINLITIHNFFIYTNFIIFFQKFFKNQFGKF